MKTEKFQRKPFIVEVVQVTAENMVDVAKWCKGTVTTTPTEIAEQLKKPVQTWIQVETQQPMNEKQKQAFVGDWILFANRGFKIYTDSAFKRTFEPVFQAPPATPQEAFFKGGAVQTEVPHPVPTPPKHINRDADAAVHRHNHASTDGCDMWGCTTDRYVDGLHRFTDKAFFATPEGAKELES